MRSSSATGKCNVKAEPRFTSPFTDHRATGAPCSSLITEGGLATLENALFAFDPTRRIVPTTKTTMTASMTGYSAIFWPRSSWMSLNRFLKVAPRNQEYEQTYRCSFLMRSSGVLAGGVFQQRGCSMSRSGRGSSRFAIPLPETPQ